MADLQILAPGVVASPLEYDIPGSVEILLKALFASFDGSGAAVSWQPAIQIIGPGGHEAGTYPVASALAAGASADVSWFPRVGGGGSAVANGTWQYATPVAPASADPSWAAGVAFENGWLNAQMADGTYNPLRYRTTAQGVQIIGAIAGGSVGTNVLTLPAAYTPPDDVFAAVPSIAGVGTFTMMITASTSALSVVGTGGPAVIVARGTFTATVSTTGTTFAAGTDILTTPLTFVADGVSDYRVVLQAIAVSSSGAANSSLFHLNLDGADGGLCTGVSTFTAGADVPGYVYAYIPQPAAGAHTVNIRITVTSNTGQIQASTSRPGLLTVERLP